MFQSFPRRDLIAYLAIVAFCFVAFEQSNDIFHTIGCSVAYLNGHFSDFYEVSTQALGDVNYLPSTYIVFALWGLPLKALGYLQEIAFPKGYLFFWYKLLTTAAFFASARLLYLIGKEAGFKNEESSFLAVIWATSPLAIFSQFIFGQYDVFTVFLMLAGMLAYFRGRMAVFTALFAVALTFKYFPVFVYFPLLLLVEKRPWTLAKHGMAALAPLSIEMLLYMGSVAFRKGVLGFEPSSRIFAAAIDLGPWGISLFFLGWFFLCAYSYLKEVEGKQELFRWASYLALLALGLLFGLIAWHPQWMIFLTPFLAITAFASQKQGFFLTLEALMMVALVAVSVRVFDQNVDQELWRAGIFGPLNPGLGTPKVFAMSWYPLFKLGPNEMWVSLFDALLLCFAVSMRPSGLQSLWTTRPQQRLDALRWRFYGGMAAFLIPALTSYALTLLR